jgi:hypothetical protein
MLDFNSHPHMDRKGMAMTLTSRAEALFTSALQPSDSPTAEQVRIAIMSSIRTHSGHKGCVAALAAEYGEHPETASARMRWALVLAAAA